MDKVFYNKQIAGSWIEAFNEHNLEKLLALYDDNARHYSPKLKIRRPDTNGMISGKASLRDWWKQAFEQLPSLRYEVLRLVADDQSVFVEYIRHVHNEDDLRVGEVLEIRNGLIISSRVFHS